MKKAKRYADGGPTAQGTYPFPQSLAGAPSTPTPPPNTNVFVSGQAQGQSPLGNALQPQPQPQPMRMAKGGAINPPFTQEPSKGKTKAELAAEAASKPAKPDPRDANIFTADKMGKDKKVPMDPEGAKAKGGAIKKMARGGGCEQRGKTRGRMV